jgi:hypothetical protein
LDEELLGNWATSVYSISVTSFGWCIVQIGSTMTGHAVGAFAGSLIPRVVVKVV